jgi:hypothetical protein
MWVARNPDGKYHLFDIKPEYDDWYRAWGEPGFYRQANDELTVQYLNTHYKRVTHQQLGFEMDWRDEPIEVETLIKIKHPNKERKERTATDRPLNNYIKEHKYNDNWTGQHCDYFDDFYDNHAVTECTAPWSFMCKGNKFDCGKLKYKWLASLSDKKRNEWLEEHEGLVK